MSRTRTLDSLKVREVEIRESRQKSEKYLMLSPFYLHYTFLIKLKLNISFNNQIIFLSFYKIYKYYRVYIYLYINIKYLFVCMYVLQEFSNKCSLFS